ncbi:uncharacterized protein TRIREDRAFT_103778 [Trichoderma reesei QM6a]|uniref:Predicted protein n=1 Tax=Hypocrea jecorina (strain QM6a) TaxID=431241 RepID=G0R9T5_HYPJQ|nr:uncharacterized protein TRIREDRAFT_103778 [Trichoderma reesei QM6a]EGR52014.1 predicted protein [Trichoderma reesei QM6a]
MACDYPDGVSYKAWNCISYISSGTLSREILTAVSVIQPNYHYPSNPESRRSEWTNFSSST